MTTAETSRPLDDVASSRQGVSRRATALGRSAAAVTSGLALAFAREPFDLAVLALVALVPLLWAWRGTRPAQAAGLAFLAGVTYHLVLLSWVWLFGAIAVVPFAAVLAAYWAAVGAAVAWLARHGLRNPLITASVWVVGDAVVSRFPYGGFSWAEAGYALGDFRFGRSLASWGGVTLVTFAVVATSDFVVDLFVAARSRSSRDVARAVAGLAVIVVLVTASHAWRVQTTAVGELRFALLQGNDINRDLTAEEEAARVLPSQHFDLAQSLEGPYDLIVFPESSLDEDPREDPWLEDQIRSVARRHSASVLVNAVTDHPDGRAVNLNLMYGPDGSLVGTYAKRHLVPFGEFVPFREQLEPLISQLDEVPRDYAPGDDAGIFDVSGYHVGTVICFETAFGPLMRSSVREGAEVMVVSTNNRSYERSPQTSQHVELSQVRAAELGRPVLHNSINGVTAVITGDGDVVSRSELFVNSVTEGTVTAMSAETPYVRYGEWVLAVSIVTLAAAVTYVLVRARRTAVQFRAAAREPEVE